ncbi:MAG: ATP-dependent helicase [Dissulfurimicrobium sp.]|uniref:ATP-dependent helicase n=1 Tax=Dissulfurimicrobium TaxID=1769732 RepID=UPI003C72BF0A
MTFPKLSENLNPEQLEAAMTLKGPVLVIAGAGSGKTRTLVFRVANLVRSGIEPFRILLLTFTKKAASTMLSRASELIGQRCEQVAGGTFHGFANSMLRRYAHVAGYPKTFTILDRLDAQDLLQFLAKELGLAGPGKHFPGKAALASIVSKAANRDLGIDGLFEKEMPHLLPELDGMKRLVSVYNEYKKVHALMDYDDLLIVWRDVLKTDLSVREAIGDRFQYIMVDEYQDTNTIQAEIIRLMATGHDNVMAVGDDAQSIYSFRGANFKNILDFPKVFPGTKIIKLERNYRSTQPNLDCTNAIIANAQERFAKRLLAQRTGGRPPRLYIARDEQDQARFVAEEISRLIKSGHRPSETAVLFRAGFHSFHIEAELKNRSIPFIKRGGMLMAEAAHIKDLLCLMRLLINPLDRLALNRVLFMFERLGEKGAEKIFADMVKSDDPIERLTGYETKAAWGDAVRGLGALIKGLQNTQLGLQDIIARLTDWYRPHLERIHPEDYPKRLQELDYLRGIAVRYEDAVSMLADLVLEQPEEDEAGSSDRDRICLSTIHSAKGLEWKTVIIISMAEGRFPTTGARDGDLLEEERRLFYVASTRAKDNLYFCYPAFITVSGSGLMPAKPSRFLKEIPSNFIEIIKSKDDATYRSDGGGARCRQPGYQRDYDNTQASAAVETEAAAMDEPGMFKAGERVRHPIFGPGRVTQIMGHEKVKVFFDATGEKTLHLAYAKLSRIGR